MNNWTELKRLIHNLIFKSCDNCKYEFVTNIHPDPCIGCDGKRFKHWSRKVRIKKVNKTCANCKNLNSSCFEEDVYDPCCDCSPVTYGNWSEIG